MYEWSIQSELWIENHYREMRETRDINLHAFYAEGSGSDNDNILSPSTEGVGNNNDSSFDIDHIKVEMLPMFHKHRCHKCFLSHRKLFSMQQKRVG